MKTRQWLMTVGLTLATMFQGFLAVPVQAIQYTITDLGALDATESHATDLNDRGQVVGWCAEGSARSAFLYSNGVMQNLGTLGGTKSQALAINNNGQVVGSSLRTPTSTESRAFLYSGGVMRDLGVMNGTAYDINDSGQVVGASYLQGFLYSNGVTDDMSSLGATSNCAYGINAAGQVVGYFHILEDPGSHAFCYSNGVTQDLGTLGGDCRALRINTSGQVVGYSYFWGQPSTYHAFLYSNGAMQDLGTLGGTRSMAYGLNDKGQVVGNANVAGDGVTRAFLYSNGVMTDLNTLLPSGSGWQLLDARAINESEQIVGTGTNPDGQIHAFLLTPVPEPMTLGLLALGGLALLRRRKA